VLQLELEQKAQRLEASTLAPVTPSPPPPPPSASPLPSSLGGRTGSLGSSRAGARIARSGRKGGCAAFDGDASRMKDVEAERDLSRARGQAVLERSTKALRRSGKGGSEAAREGRRLLVELSAQGVHPDGVLFNAMLSLATKKGTPGRAKWEAAREVLDMMAQHGVKPDVTSYNVLLSAAAESGEGGGGALERCRAIMTRMEAAGVQPDQVSYSTAVHACTMVLKDIVAPGRRDSRVRAGGDTAESRADIPSSSTSSPSSPLSPSDSKRYTRADEAMECAIRYMEEMESSGYEPNIVSYTSLLQVRVPFPY
jgi:hypothetical protein